MVELVHIYLHNAMLKCGELKKQLMLKDKEKLDKLLKEKFQLEKQNDLKHI